LIGRLDIEERERQTLAMYAALASESRGRVYPQPEHPLRTAFQRDRDRIIHAAAFRRLDYKTQVFIPHLTDHFRTRLTHTIEVAQVSRTLARNLCLNEDLTEAVALVHDLGHTPFGHAGEDVLNELMADHGGFNHNRQSLRVVDLLEQRYPDHPGLNLTYEVREGIAKHETKGKIVSSEFEPVERPTLEASLVDMADELTYSAHDIDDGLNAGLISVADIRHLAIWSGDDSPLAPGNSSNVDDDSDELRHRLVRFLIDRLAGDLLDSTTVRLAEHGICDLAALRSAPTLLCAYSDEIEPAVKELKQFLYKHMYRHEKLLSLSERAQLIIRVLFEALTSKPDLMPARYQAMLAGQPMPIVIADYIAGMTDRYAEKLYEQLT
jgi:dGTPase